ncbi:hypothetical protein AJ78_05630 [Emergomyces pasteurianus Ep9510]|uniref:DUF202 domain-containing protein n=1 Tax=Emergomyces pasteurianus Ep9510 TaxID=1447872 RepID=A0A1J9PD89_9EURO|nr:hypothetical protein AJ78_05630 [Emergomyces pasteurianus Ep9510]
MTDAMAGPGLMTSTTAKQQHTSDHSPYERSLSTSSDSLVSSSSGRCSNRQAVAQPAPTEDTPIAISSRQRSERNYRSTENVVDGYGAADMSTQLQQQPQQPQPPQRKPSTHQPDGQELNNGGRGGAISRNYKRIVDKYGSIELENKGSVARDHLALERTFLAWLRTSLAFASIGIAVTQLFRLNSTITESNAHLLFDSSQSQQQQQLQYPPQAFSTADPRYSQNQQILPPPLPADLLLDSLNNPASASSPSASPSTSTSSAALSAVANQLLAHIEGGKRLRSLGKPLGATFISIAIVVLIIGFHRYFEGQYWVIRGKFPASRASIALVAFIAGSLMVSCLVVILTISPGALER